jgi:hypothetical protein
LLITAPPADAHAICAALQSQAIACTDIGVVLEGPARVHRRTAVGVEPWPQPAADAITQVFDAGQR